MVVNGVSGYSSVASVYSKAAKQGANVEAEKKNVGAKKFDQILLSTKSGAEPTAAKDIKSKISTEMRTSTSIGDIAAIKNQIKSGTYKIDAEEIARKMLLQED